MRLGGLVTSAAWKSRLPTWLLLVKVGLGLQVFPCCLARGELSLSKHFLFVILPLCPLARRSLLLLGLLLSVPIDVSGLPGPLAPSLRYIGQKEISGICHSIVAWVLKVLVGLPSLSTYRIFLIFVLYIISRGFSCT